VARILSNVLDNILDYFFFTQPWRRAIIKIDRFLPDGRVREWILKRLYPIEYNWERD